MRLLSLLWMRAVIAAILIYSSPSEGGIASGWQDISPSEALGANRRCYQCLVRMVLWLPSRRMEIIFSSGTADKIFKQEKRRIGKGSLLSWHTYRSISEASAYLNCSFIEVAETKVLNVPVNVMIRYNVCMSQYIWNESQEWACGRGKVAQAVDRDCHLRPVDRYRSLETQQNLSTYNIIIVNGKINSETQRVSAWWHRHVFFADLHTHIYAYMNLHWRQTF